MADPRFDILFQGKLVGGAEPDAVQANLMRLFKIDAARAAAMLSGQSVTLKKDADQATAMKFRAALKQAGALCELVALGVNEAAAAQESEDIQLTSAPAPAPVAEPARATNQPPAPATSAAAASSDDQQMVGTIRTGGAGFSGAFSVAPVGADMDQAPDTRAPVHPDTSALSMAPLGADMNQQKAPPPPAPPDTSELSLAPEK